MMRMRGDMRTLRVAVAWCLLAVAWTGCVKKSGEAVVVHMEHVPAKVTGDPAKDDLPTHRERCLVTVQMTADSRRVLTDVEPEKFAALKVGDRVKAHYWKGKYTGTVWVGTLD